VTRSECDCGTQKSTPSYEPEDAQSPDFRGRRPHLHQVGHVVGKVVQQRAAGQARAPRGLEALALSAAQRHARKEALLLGRARGQARARAQQPRAVAAGRRLAQLPRAAGSGQSMGLTAAWKPAFS